MKLSRLRLAFLALLCGTASLQADILVLKNGSRVEGNILKESPEAIQMRYRLTPKIWDEKSFPMADIQQVIKQTPQEVEVVELRKVMPTADLLTADKYEQLIQDRLRPFVNKYKGTPEATEVEKIISDLQAEKAKVAAGQVKLEGKWLTVEEAKAEQFNIEAFQLLKAIRAKVAEGKWSEALREYDTFLRQSPALRGTKYYPMVISEARTALDSWAPVLAKMATEQPLLKKAREDGLKALEETERAKTKAAIATEVATLKADAQAARNNRLRWIDPNKYDNVGIQTTQKEVLSEKARLQAIDLDALKVQNEAFGVVLRKIGEKDYAGGANAFQQVAHLTSNPQYKDIIEDLKRRLMVIYTELAKQRTAAGAMASGSSAIGGVASTTQDQTVARILAEAAGGAPTAPAAGAPVAGAQVAPAAAVGAPAVGAPAMAAPVGAPAGGGVAPAVRPAAPVAPAAAAYPAAAPMPQAIAPPMAQVLPPVEPSNFQTYLLIGAGALILVLLIAMMQQKKKNQE